MTTAFCAKSKKKRWTAVVPEEIKQDPRRYVNDHLYTKKFKRHFDDIRISLFITTKSIFFGEWEIQTQFKRKGVQNKTDESDNRKSSEKERFSSGIFSKELKKIEHKQKQTR